MEVALRKHQTNAIKHIDSCYAKGFNNVCSVLPTGAGKTFLIAYYAKCELKRKNTCFIIAHRDVLLEQISNALCMFHVKHSFICSDITLRDITNLNYKNYNDSFYDANSTIILVSVDTFKARLKKRKINNDLLLKTNSWILDECHHLTKNSKWGDCIESLPNAIGLGLTATPIRNDGKGLGREAEGYFDVLSVTTNMHDMILSGYLSPYKIFAPTEIDASGIHVTASGDYNSRQLAQRTRESFITGSAVEHYKKYVYGQPAITFAVDILHAESVADEFNRAGIPSKAVSSKTPAMERQQAITDLRNGKLWNLVNVDLYGEGFDSPAVVAVFMLRKTESYSLFKQQFGRCLRTAEDKSYGYIFDHVGNVANMCAKYGLLTPHDDPVWTLKNRNTRKNAEWIECNHCMHIAPLTDFTDMLCPECNQHVSKSDNIERVTCEMCFFQAPLHDVYDPDGNLLLHGFTKNKQLICPNPDCQHVHTIEQSESIKTKIQYKHGDLKPLSVDAIDAIIAKRLEVDKSVDEFKRCVGNAPFAHMAINKHINRANAQHILRDAIMKWCHDQYIKTGHTIEYIQREFEITFGTNIFVSQTLSANKAIELAEIVKRGTHARD